jgi:hypothetical protein
MPEREGQRKKFYDSLIPSQALQLTVNPHSQVTLPKALRHQGGFMSVVVLAPVLLLQWFGLVLLYVSLNKVPFRC